MKLFVSLILILIIGASFVISGLAILQMWRLRMLCKSSKWAAWIYMILAVAVSIGIFSVFLAIEW